MKTETKKIDSCKRELSIEVAKEAVSEHYEQVINEIAKRVHLKGFRPGKAPRQMVEQNYSKLAWEEVMKDLIPEYYTKAIEKDKLNPATSPQISDVELKDGKLFFKAKFDIRPEVKLNNYKGIKVKSPKVSVKENEISEALDRLRKTFATAPKQTPEAEKKEEPKLPELDDEFAKKVGFKDLTELKSKVKEELLHASKHRVENEERHQIVKHLLGGADFEVPESWVTRQSAQLLNHERVNLLMSGVKKEEVESKLKEQEDQINKQAKDNVRLFFVLESIADKEKIEVTKEELLEHAKMLAYRQGISEEQMHQYIDKKNLWEDLAVEIRQEKAMDFLINAAEKDSIKE